MVLLKFGALSLAIALPAASLFSSAITPTNIISLTNSSRSSLKLPTLHENALLDASAQAKAEDMMAHQYFAHTSPAGITPWSWIKGEGYSYTYAGENLAVYFSQAEDVESGWMASPTHRANIVNTRFTDIGVGVSSGKFNGYPAIFVVQHFGKPSATVAILGEQTSATEPTVTITPKHNAYNIAVTNNEATAVTTQLGTSTTQLIKTGENTWQGSISVNQGTLAQNGEQLTLTVSDTNGRTTVQPVAIVAPSATTQDLYAFENKSPEAKLFGVRLHGLSDGVRQVYLLSIIFLAGLLLITLIAKTHWRRLPLTAHVMAVIGIAVLLMAI